jgi:HlyD family secretion protein
MDFIPKELTDRTLESLLIKVNTRSKLIYWLLIIILIVAITSLPLIKVDVAVRARGFFQSEIERQALYAPTNGKVLFTAISTGKNICQGDTLFVISSDAVKAEMAAIEQKILDNNEAIVDLKELLSMQLSNDRLSRVSVGTKRYYAEYISLLRLIELQAQSYHKTKSDYERKKILYEQKIISAAEYEVIYYNLRSEEENLMQVFSQNKAKWELDLAQRRNDSIVFQAELQRCFEEISNRVIIAPLSGEIVQSTDIQSGTFVNNNQRIAEISPVGEIVAICYVSPGDIGLVKPGLQALIQVDALKYTEWGLLKAEIIDVANDMIIDEAQSAYFRIKCKPEKSYLSLKNGVNADLMKGMSFTARIVIAKRTLFNLLFDKADDWLNPYMN